MRTGRSTILVFIFLLLLTRLFSQECTLQLQGRVLDKGQKTPLEFAYIYAEEAKTGVFTDEEGFYLFTGLCEGHYHVVISHLGCETVTEYVHVHESGKQDFYLNHHHHVIDEITVRESVSVYSSGLIKKTVSTDQLLENSGKPLAALLTEIPGVSSLGAGPGLSKPLLDGMYGNRVVIANQGIPQEGQQWGIDHAPELDPNLVDVISVVRGTSAIKYGMQALGGVVLTEEKIKNNDPHWHGSLKTGYQSNGHQTQLYSCLRKAFDKSNIILRAGGQFGGDMSTPDYYLTNTGMRQASASISWVRWIHENAYQKFHYSFYGNETGIFRGAHIGNLTDLREALSRDRPFFAGENFSFDINAPRQKIFHHLAKYNYSKTLENGDGLQFTAGWQVNQRQEFDIRRGGRSSRPSLDLLLITQHYDFNFTKKNTETGFQYRQANNVNIPGTGILPLIPDYESYQLASYFIRKWQKPSSLWEWGVRADYRYYHAGDNRLADSDLQRGFLNVASNLGFSGNTKKVWTYTVDLSFTIRPPEINELLSNGLHQGVAGIEEGNPDMEQEKAMKLVHSWTGHVDNKHLFQASVFTSAILDYIYLLPTKEIRLTIRGAFPVFKYRRTDVWMSGLTARYEWKPSDMFSWAADVNYTLATDLETGNSLIYIPPFTARCQVAVILPKTRLYREMKLGAEIIYAARQDRVDPNQDLAPPPDAYLLANLFTRVKWKRRNQQDIEMVLGVDNLFNQTYRNYLNRLRYFADEPGRNVYCTVYMSF